MSLEAAYSKMEKRGEIDKALGALPIFFLVLVIVAVFVALNAGVFAFKKTSDHVSVYGSTRMPVVFEEITLELNGKKERMSVLGAFNITRTNAEARERLLDNIAKTTPNNGCLAFLWWDPETDINIYGESSAAPHGFFAKKIGGNVEYPENNLEDLFSRKKLYDSYVKQGRMEEAKFTFAIDKLSYHFMTYRGECPNV